MMYALNSREMKGESFKRGEYRCLNNPDPQFQCTLPMQDYAGRTVVWLHEKVPRSTTTAGPRRVCYVCVEVDINLDINVDEDTDIDIKIHFDINIDVDVLQKSLL